MQVANAEIINLQDHDTENQPKLAHESSAKVDNAEVQVDNAHYPQGIRFWLITSA